MKDRLQCEWRGSNGHESAEAGDACVSYLKRKVETLERAQVEIRCLLSYCDSAKDALSLDLPLTKSWAHGLVGYVDRARKALKK